LSEATARAIVAERSRGKCEAVIPVACTGEATDMHHRYKPGRIWVPSNLLHLCRQCHDWIERHPDLANRWGLSLRAGEHPNATSALMRWENFRTWVFLDDDGCFEFDESDFEPLVFSWGAAPQSWAKGSLT
jgi:hypothetical protein